MERAPVPLQFAGRAASIPLHGRPAARTSFDPSASSHAPACTKLAHAKEYGSSFSDGFLKFLRCGDLSDVVVEVVRDPHDTDADVTPVPAPGPHPAHAAEPRFNRAYSSGPSTSTPSTTSRCCDAGSGGSSCPACPAQASVLQTSPSAPGPTRLPFSISTTSACPASASVATTTPPSHAPAATSGLGEFHLHGLLLARHSAFFAAALGQSHFADSAARRIRLTLDAAAVPAWPALVEYFYTDRIQLDDSNALPLLALARQLLVPELDGYCTDYVCGRLCATNCLTHLRAAVRFALHDLHSECVTLAAQGFPLLYDSDLSGLPPASLLEILTHPLLQVHCELQVVEAITRYLATTAVDVEAQRALCAQIRFAYLDNATITRLAVQPSALLMPATSGDGVASQEAADDADPDAVAVADTGAHPRAVATVSGSSGAQTVSEAVSGADGPDVTEAANGDMVAGTTRGSVGTADGQGASGVGDGGGSGTDTSGASGSSGASVGEGPAAGEAADGGAVAGDAAAAVAEDAAEADGSVALAAEVSSLMSLSGSACSSPASSCGGAAGASDAFQPHHPPNPCVQVVDSPGTRRQQHQQQMLQPRDHQQLVPGAPLLPRDMTLEGALARLAAMEFHASLHSAQQQALQGGPLDPSQAPAQGGGAAAGSGTGAAGQSPYHPYFHPYQQYQFRYQYGTGAAVQPGAAAPLAGGHAAAAAAAAANGGRRPLAVFPGMGGPQPGPPPPPPGPAGAGGAVRPLAHEGGAPVPHLVVPPLPQYISMHTALALSFTRRPVPGSTGAAAGGDGTGSGRTEGVSGPAERALPPPAAAALMDPAAAYAAACLPPPRLSYCCNVMHGLPGGCAWVDVALEALWEHLVPYITIQVSGCSEGSPGHVVSSDPDSFFETNDSADPLPWVEVQLPHNVHVLQLHRYTFMHGHRRAGYYRARNFKTQIAVRPASEGARSAPRAAAAGGGAAPASTGGVNQVAGGGGGGGAVGAPAAAAAAGATVQRPGPAAQVAGSAAAAPAAPPASASPACRYFDLTTRMAEQFDVMVLAGAAVVGPWRVLRLQATGAQEDGVHRLCVRGVRMYGVARVDLMHQANGFVVQPQWILNARIDQGGSGGGAAGVGGAGPSCGGGGGAAAGAGPGGAGYGYSGGGGGGGLPHWFGWQHTA